MLHTETIAVYCGSVKKHVVLNTFCGGIADFVFKADGGIYNNHCTLREIFTGVFSSLMKTN